MRKVIYLAAIALCLVACSIGGYNDPGNGGNTAANYCKVTVYNKCQYDAALLINDGAVMFIDPKSNNSRDLVQAEQEDEEKYTDKLYPVKMCYFDYTKYNIDMGSSSTNYTFKKGNNYTIVIATDMTFRITKD